MQGAAAPGAAPAAGLPSAGHPRRGLAAAPPRTPPLKRLTRACMHAPHGDQAAHDVNACCQRTLCESAQLHISSPKARELRRAVLLPCCALRVCDFVFCSGATGAQACGHRYVPRSARHHVLGAGQLLCCLSRGMQHGVRGRVREAVLRDDTGPLPIKSTPVRDGISNTKALTPSRMREGGTSAFALRCTHLGCVL